MSVHGSETAGSSLPVPEEKQHYATSTFGYGATVQSAEMKQVVFCLAVEAMLALRFSYVNVSAEGGGLESIRATETNSSFVVDAVAILKMHDRSLFAFRDTYRAVTFDRVRTGLFSMKPPTW